MKKFILAIVVAIAAIYPNASLAANDSSKIISYVKSFNDQNNSSISAAWADPYIDIFSKSNEVICAELNKMLADKETAPIVMDMVSREFLSEPELNEVLLSFEEDGLKGVRFNIIDKAGVKSTFLFTIDDIRAYKSSENADYTMNKVVKDINGQNNPALTAAWEAPYLIMNIKIDDVGCAEMNKLLNNKETACELKNNILEQFLSTPKMTDTLLALEMTGLKGMRINLTDKVGAKTTFVYTIEDIHTYKDSKK